MKNGTGHAREVVIIGAGGHARVIADTLLRLSTDVTLKGFLDDRSELHGTKVLGLPVLGSLGEWLSQHSPSEAALVVGIGDNQTRERIAGKIAAAGFEFATAVHPSAQIAVDVEIGAGTVIMANAVVNTGARLGEHVILNTSASVDHDCVIEDMSHISPGAHMAGTVTVKRGTHVGTGATVIPGVTIGEWAVVGAGGTVVKDVSAFTTVAGRHAVPVATSIRGEEQRTAAK